jgi:hypothetical protein
MTDDLPFDYPDTSPPNLGAAQPKRCRRHLWDGGACARCDRVRDEALIRRGKNNRARGNRAELEVARQFTDGRKVGPLGHPWDVEIPGYMRLQVKKLARWPSLSTVVDWIDAIPPSSEMRAVAVIQPGRGGRRLLVVDLDEYAEHHGDPTKRGVQTE